MTRDPATGVRPDQPVADEPLRVMIVDDSSVVRGLLTRLLERQPDIKVVSSVSDGQMAVNALRRYDIDVVILDIEMPRMDGLTALPMLLDAKPNTQVIVASTLTEKNAEIAIQALERGAADYLTKPTSAHGWGSMEVFSRQLVEKVIALGYANRDHPRPASPSLPRRRVAPSPEYRPSTRPADREYRPSVRPGRPKVRVVERTARDTGDEAAYPLTRPAPKEIVLRAAAKVRPEIIAIGSSTGGPQALFEILRHLAGEAKPPILVTQHMPATFTTLLAEHIARVTGQACSEAKDGEPIRPGKIYIAPGNFHMVVEKTATANVIRLTQGEPENFCRPSVDPMLRSMAEIYGSRLLVLMLTGMGSDGQQGAEVVTQAGGAVIAQDEATSVVWGMPGSVATNGLCSAVLPLNEIGPYVDKLVMRPAA